MSLEELEAATSSQPLVVLDMEEKLLDKNPTCVNKSKRSLGRLWSRLYVSNLSTLMIRYTAGFGVTRSTPWSALRGRNSKLSSLSASTTTTRLFHFYSKTMFVWHSTSDHIV